MKNIVKCKLISQGLMIGGILLFMITAGIFGANPLHPASYLAAVVILIGLIYGIITVRCPNCHRLLTLRGACPKVCPHCGETLR